MCSRTAPWVAVNLHEQVYGEQGYQVEEVGKVEEEKQTAVSRPLRHQRALRKSSYIFTLSTWTVSPFSSPVMVTLWPM